VIAENPGKIIGKNQVSNRSNTGCLALELEDKKTNDNEKIYEHEDETTPLRQRHCQFFLLAAYSIGMRGNG